MGHKRSDLTAEPVWFWALGAYLIIYRTDPLPIELIAVTHGARNIPLFLRLRTS
jgi:plasmid stabilization system protein ParE